MPVVLFCGLLIWLLVFYVTRYVSVASIAFGLSLPVSGLLRGLPRAELALAILIAILLVVRHRSNIRRLAAGTEDRFIPGKD